MNADPEVMRFFVQRLTMADSAALMTTPLSPDQNRWHSGTSKRVAGQRLVAPRPAAMKSTLLALSVALAGLPAFAANPPLEFSDREIELPPLSLGEAAKQEQQRWLGEALDRRTSELRAPRPARAFSRMPVKQPDEIVDGKLHIVPPDPSTEHKLRIVRPELDSAR